MSTNTNPQITGTRYVLAVKNLEKSGKFYEESLGFKTYWKGVGWQFLKRDQCIIMLGECPDDIEAFETKNHSYFAYIDILNIEELYNELVSKKVEILSKPKSKPWGQREFAIRTIDGHRIMFGQEIE